MSKIITTLEAKIYLELTEGEAGALDAICGYGPEEFLKWFERNLGKHYIEPYRKDVKTLFDKARKLKYSVEKVKQARNAIKEITC